MPDTYPSRALGRLLPVLVTSFLLLVNPLLAQTQPAPIDPLAVRPVHDASNWGVAKGALKTYWDEWKGPAGVDDMGHSTAPLVGAVATGGYQADEVPVEFRTWVVTRAAQDGLLVVGNSADVATVQAQEIARADAAARAAAAAGGEDDDEPGSTDDGGDGSDDDGGDGSDDGGDGSDDGGDGTDDGGDGSDGGDGATDTGDTSTGGTASREPKEYTYGNDHERQKLDVYLPSGEGPFPTIVFFHGGGFYRGDKKSIDKFLPMLDKGYAMVGVNYKLDKDPAAAADDSRKAVAFLRGKISGASGEFPFKEDQFVSAGASAGGYLAALLGANGSKHGAQVNAVIDLAGPTDFKSFGGQFFYNANMGPRRFAFQVPDNLGDLSGALNGIAGTALNSDYSVLENVSGQHPPAFIRHGKDDSVVPPQQSARYAQELKKAGVYTWYEQVDASHGLTPELAQKVMEDSHTFLQCRDVFGSGDCPGK